MSLAVSGCGTSASGFSTDGAAVSDAPASTGGSLGGSGGNTAGGAGGGDALDVPAAGDTAGRTGGAGGGATGPGDAGGSTSPGTGGNPGAGGSAPIGGTVGTGGGIVGTGGSGGSGTGGGDSGVVIGPGCVARTPGQWQLTSTVDEPPPLSQNGLVLWSGSALFLIGYDTPGGKYDPCLDVWQTFPGNSTFSRLVLATGDGAYFYGVSTLSAPMRFSHFDFAALAWRDLSIEGYPTAANLSGAAAMVGGKLVRWGGKSDEWASPYPLLANTGATYDPVTDRWQAMSTAGAPSARVIAGNYVAAAGRLFVWGGARTYPGVSGIATDDPTAAAMTKAPGLVCPSWDPYECSYGDGALYDPAKDSWTPTSQSGAPAARRGGLTAWTGTRVLVWGGSRWIGPSPESSTGWSRPENFTDGALYDPATDSWTPVAPAPALKYSYSEPVATWSDRLMYMSDHSDPQSPTYTYDPATDRWAIAQPGPAMPARTDGPNQPTTLWTGSYWIAYGGYRNGATPPNPCLTMQPPPTTGCDPPGPEHIRVSEAAVALPAQ